MRVLPLVLLLALLAAGCMAPPGDGPAPSATSSSSSSSPSPAFPSLARGASATAPTIPLSSLNVTDETLPGTPAAAGNGTYWFVRVSGDQGEFQGYVCDRGFSHLVDTGSREVQLDARRYPYDPARVRSLAAAQVDDGGGCPVADAVQAGQASDPLLLGRLGDVWISIDEADGTATVLIGNWTWDVAPGHALRLRTADADDDHVLGATLDVSFANHGAWPRSGLQVIEDWRNG